jgi:hypothetical protein
MRSDFMQTMLRRILAVMASIGCASSPISAASPDFNGVWLYVGAHMPAQAASDLFNAEREWPPGGVPQLREPYATELQELVKKQKEAEENGKPLADAYSQCIPNGMPMMMGSVLPIEILQTRGKLVVIAEELSQVRRIYLDERLPALEALVPNYNGYSVGHWESDTLVIVTRGVREDARWNNVPHTLAMTVTERWRLKGPDELENRITIEDPSIMTRPHSFSIEYKRDRSHRLEEYICENNRYETGADDEQRLHIEPSP